MIEPFQHNKIPNITEDDLLRVWCGTNGPSLPSADGLKVFISHRDTHKIEAQKIQKALGQMGILSFVAHIDIAPTQEWTKEILRALQSMDICLLYMSDDFFDSSWTNQEVGFALGADIPVVMLKAPKTPEGFASIMQAMPYRADSFLTDFTTLLATDPTILANKYDAFISHLIQYFGKATSFFDAPVRFKPLAAMQTMSAAHVQEIAEVAEKNVDIYGCFYLLGGGFGKYQDSPLLLNKLKEWTNHEWQLINNSTATERIFKLLPIAKDIV